jgi:beta-N-acetylhexosaminidase
MGAVVSKFGAGEAAVRAFLAGSDLLLMPADPAGAIDALERAVLDGRIPARRLDASVRRVLAIKQRLGLFARRTVPLAPIIRTVGARELQASADDIAVRSLTVVRDGGALRALREQPGSLALIVYGDELHTYLGTRLTEALRSNGATVDFFRLWPMSGTLSYDSARAVVARQPRTVFVADVRPLSGRGTITMPDAYAALVTGTDAVKPTVLVSLGSPYLLDQAPRVKSYVLAWSHAPASERAVALALLGRVPITGRLPIRLPPNYAVGDGIMFGDTAAPASR